MVKFEVTILGNNSSYPVHGRYPSSQILEHNGNLYLIDCGEGSQIRIAEYGIKRTRIDHVFISHLHGDHVFGLPGFVNSFVHFSRQRPLHIYGPVGIRQMIETILRLSGSRIEYDVVFHEIDADTRVKVLQEGGLKVYAFPMTHRIPTYGYVFEEVVKEPNIRPGAIEEHGISISQINALKKEYRTPADFGWPDDILYKREPRKYAYCSDTVYDTGLVQWIKGVDLLYHESTFLHSLEGKALETKHSTSFQAGMIARLAEVGKLIIGHFSSRYVDPTPLLEEAREVFTDTDLAIEGTTFPIGSDTGI